MSTHQARSSLITRLWLHSVTWYVNKLLITVTGCSSDTIYEDMTAQLQRFSPVIFGRVSKNKQLPRHPGSGARKYLYSWLPPLFTIIPLRCPAYRILPSAHRVGFPVMFYLLCQFSLKTHLGSTQRYALPISLIAVKPIKSTVKISHHM